MKSMNEAREASSTSIRAMQRRGLLRGGTAALLAAGAVAATARAAPVALPEAAGDDAELIKLCAECHRLTAVMAAWPRDDDNGFEANLRERWKVSDAIMSLSAATDRGRREKAMVALVQLEENYGPGEGQTIRTVLAALSDIAGRGVA
jgi:hypothetical protein